MSTFLTRVNLVVVRA